MDIVKCWLSEFGYYEFMSFNEHLKRELEYKGMLVKELAYMTGIPKQTIDKYLLTSGTMPPADKAVAIAGALGVTVEYLITGKKVLAQKAPNNHLSPEMRLIANYVEPLSREKRKVVQNVVIELVTLLQQPPKDEIPELNLLQKVFFRLFRLGRLK
jgi:transcriptional regulator with XRE-family HTH domain